MQESTGYGKRFGEAMRSRATAFVSRSLHNSNVAITELRSDNPEPGISAKLVREDAFVIGHTLVDYPVHEYFEEERAAPVTALKGGQTILWDLNRDPRFNINKAIHSVHFYFPRGALNAIADNVGAPRIKELHFQPGVGVNDSVMQALVSSLLPSFQSPENTCRLFVEQVTMAAGFHVAKVFGGMKLIVRPLRGGLAPWQIKRAEEKLAANLEGNVSLADLAAHCGVSVGHFARAFRRSVGLSPHQWLLRRRVDEAKHLMRSRTLTLSEVALACGFVDQSHFTRVFARRTGISPGAWRRNIA